MIYLDTAVFAKLIWSERETVSLQQFLAARTEMPLVSSALLAVEVRRAVLREDPTQMLRADLLLTRVGQIGLTRAVLEAAGRLPDPHLRSLNATHLATALLLNATHLAVVTYDNRLATTAERHHPLFWRQESNRLTCPDTASVACGSRGGLDRNISGHGWLAPISSPA